LLQAALFGELVEPVVREEPDATRPLCRRGSRLSRAAVGIVRLQQGEKQQGKGEETEKHQNAERDDGIAPNARFADPAYDEWDEAQPE